ARFGVTRNVAWNHRSLPSFCTNTFRSLPAASFVEFNDEHVTTMAGKAYCQRLTDAAAADGDYNILVCIIEKLRHDLHGALNAGGHSGKHPTHQPDHSTDLLERLRKRVCKAFFAAASWLPRACSLPSLHCTSCK